MERTRAWRRHHLYRMKKKAFRILWNENHFSNLEDARKYSRKMANHLAHCSCAGCGNPRKHWNDKKIAEKKADISFSEQIKYYLDQDEE